MATALPMPLFLVLKNGALCIDLVVGCGLLGRQYNSCQFCAVLLICVGCSLSAWSSTAKQNSGEVATEYGVLLGIAFQSSALFMRSCWSGMQEQAMKASGGYAPAAEMVFFRALFGLPCLLSKSSNIASHVMTWNQPSVAGLRWPGMWLLLVIKLLLDHALRISAYRLAGATSSLTVSVTLTLQRLISFVLSALVLNPAMDSNIGVWMGSLIVFAGAFFYAAIPKPIAAQLNIIHKGKVA
jgi:hypothetical protein